MTSECPLITIYIPTYNRVGLLRRAVNSVLAQSYRNFELIIVDDGSCDGTLDYLSELQKQDLRVRFFLNDENVGACASRNTAISKAKGEFITGLDDDDFFLPSRIADFVAHIDGLEKAGFLYADSIVKLPNKKPFATNRPDKIKYKDLLITNYVGNQVFIRTKLILLSGGFNVQLKIWQDLELWLRLLKFSGLTAAKIKSTTYVVDKSHPHERIGNRNHLKIIDAYNHIIANQPLSAEQVALLDVQLFSCTPEKLTTKAVVSIITTSRSFKASAKIALIYLIMVLGQLRSR